MILPSFWRFPAVTFFEEIVPEVAISLPVKLPFEAILPVFLIFPDTFTSSAVSTTPSFSSFPETVTVLFAFTVPEVDISSLETVPTAAISPVFVTFLAVIFSPAVIFPSFFKSSTFTFLEEITPAETVFLPLKLPPAIIFPLLLISPETATFFEVSTVPSLSNLPLIERSSLVLKAPEDFRLSAEILPTTVISPVLETFLAVKSLLATIFPSFLRFPVFKLFETTVPEVSIFFEVKSPLVTISPEFNTFPATDISFEAPTVPLLSRSPSMSSVSLVWTFPEVTRLLPEILPDAKICPVFFTSFAIKSPFVLIFPSLVRFSTLKFLAAIAPDVTVFLAVKSSFVKIFPVLLTFPKTEIRLTEVNAPVLSNFPLMSVIPETCIFPELSKFLTLKFPPERTVAREFLKLPAVIFPETFMFPELIISNVFKFPPEYIFDLFSTFPLRLMSSFAWVSPDNFILAALILIPLSELASSLWTYSVPFISMPFPLIFATLIFPSAVISSFVSLE